MARKNTVPTRIDIELRNMIRDIAMKNNMTLPEASKNIAITLKEFKMKEKKSFKEIIF